MDYGTETSTQSDSADTGSDASSEDTEDIEDTETSESDSDANVGLNTNDIAPNLSASSASGMPWSLYEQSGMVLLMVGNADGMGLMRMLEQAESLPKEAQHVLLLGNNGFATPADAADAAQLQSTHPALDVVLLDPTLEQVNTWAERAPPKAYLIDKDHQIPSGLAFKPSRQLSFLSCCLRHEGRDGFAEPWPHQFQAPQKGHLHLPLKPHAHRQSVE